MRRVSFVFLIPPFSVLAAVTALAATPSERRAELPAGAAIVVKAANVRADSIVLSVTIANPGAAAVRFNRGRGLVLDEGAGATHHLNPPPDNPELEIAPGAQFDGELVFIGPPAPATRHVSLSNGTFHDELALQGGDTAGSAAHQAGRDDGTTVRLIRVGNAGGTCLISLLATNGSDRTLLLNQNRSLVLTDGRGKAAPVEAPRDNRELVVPAGDRLDAELAFDCRALDTAGPLTLTSRGQSDGKPAFAIEAAAAPIAGAAPAARSRAAVKPIAWSMLLEAPPTATSTPAPGPAPGPTATPSPGPRAAVPPAEGDKVAHLAAALHAHKTERGLRLSLPAAPLFAAGAAIAPTADRTLGQLAALIAAGGMREVVVTVHATTAGREQARAIVTWLEKHVPQPAPRFIADAKDAPPSDPNSVGAAPPEPQRRTWIDVVLRRDYLVPNKRSPASPSPGKM